MTAAGREQAGARKQCRDGKGEPEIAITFGTVEKVGEA